MKTSGAALSTLNELYEGLERQWQVEVDPEFATLVIPNGNGGSPVHRWFRMKEAFSCDLLTHVARRLNLEAAEDLAVLDPLSGSGTVGVSLCQSIEAGTWRRGQFLGFETNPYLHLVASTKLRTFQSRPGEFDDLAQRIGAVVARQDVEPAETPPLSTFANPDYFSSENVAELLRIRSAIEVERSRGAEPLALDLAAVCLGASVGPASRLRRDGRALRFEPEKVPIRPLTAFLERCESVADDLPASRIPVEGEVVLADAREEIAGHDSVGPFDLALFSPPYPNNIDYTEVYKLEAWLLGYYTDAETFTSQRHRTIRSHASLKFPEEAGSLPEVLRGRVDELLEPVLEAVPEGSRYTAGRRRTIKGYAYDMLRTLIAVRSRMKTGGHVVYVVGNSLHGTGGQDSVLIAADLLIAELANLADMSIDRICVARTPQRRRAESRFLRESVVFAST